MPAMRSEQGREIVPCTLTQPWKDMWASKWPNPPWPIALHQPPPSTQHPATFSDVDVLCGLAPQRTLHTTLRCTPPTTPGGTNPSLPFTLRHPPRHPSPTTPCRPHTKCTEEEPSIPAQHPTPPATHHTCALRENGDSIHTPWT